MKTGQDVRESGLYSSDCCEQELLFTENDAFSRCPRCFRLCEWELVDSVISWKEMSHGDVANYLERSAS
jgi:hypothetical protein